MAKRKAEQKVKRAVERSMERALKEERLALAAVTKVMLLEIPNPARVLARLDAMVRAAEANPRTPITVRRQLLDATRFVRTAIERETGKPQTLFDPHVGHLRRDEVDRLVAPTEGPQQLGLINNETLLGDAEAAHEERVRTIATVHNELVNLLRADGPATDLQLYDRYRRAWADVTQRRPLPVQSSISIRERRAELVAAGRVVPAGKRDGETTFDIVERELL